MSDNPFLLPPGGAKAPAVPQAPDASPSPNPSHYIAVPASVESATRRVSRPAPEPERPAPDSEQIAEETRVAPPAAPRSWALVLPDGTRVSLDGPLLLGRDPAGIHDRPDAGLLPLADPGKTVSKTHALLETTPEGVRVRDLHSTNGVAVDTAGGRELLPAGGEAIAPFGATIMLGSFPLGVAAS
jgi:hypothetical protein